MRTLAPTILAVVLGTALGAACSPVTDRVDTLTGTTLDERCAAHRALIAIHDARVEAGSEITTPEEVVTEYRIFVAAVCPQP